MERFRRFLRATRSFFVALLRSIRNFKSRYIRVSYTLYFLVPKTKIRLISTADDNTADLSIADVRKIFSVIKAACDARETRVPKVGSLEWTIEPRWVDAEVTITIRSGLSRITHYVGWHDIERASKEFSSWFDGLWHEVGGLLA